MAGIDSRLGPRPRKRPNVGCVVTVALLGVGALLAFTCSRDHTPAETPDYTYRAAAQELVRRHLRDPDSATFSNIEVMRGTAERATVVCGVVNARNGFGGMAGPERFVAGATTTLESEVGAETMDSLWRHFC